MVPSPLQKFQSMEGLMCCPFWSCSLPSCRKPFLLTASPAAALPFGAHTFPAAMKAGCSPHHAGAMPGGTLESCPIHQDSLCPLQVFKVTGVVGGKPRTLRRVGPAGRDPVATVFCSSSWVSKWDKRRGELAHAYRELTMCEASF